MLAAQSYGDTGSTIPRCQQVVLFAIFAIFAEKR